MSDYWNDNERSGDQRARQRIQMRERFKNHAQRMTEAQRRRRASIKGAQTRSKKAPITLAVVSIPMADE